MQSRSFILLAVGASLYAQNGGIQGVVKDQSEALVPAVQVVATNLDTGLRREASTNEAGLYVFPTLPVGRYKIAATREAFRPPKSPTSSWT